MQGARQGGGSKRRNSPTTRTSSWQPSSDPAVVGYRIVWRSTGPPAWRRSRDVGLVAQVRRLVSRDNVIVGVHALGASGESSLARYPLAQRK